MAIPDSTSAPLFIEDQPDWGQTVSVDSAWSTIVQASRNSGEQRARQRSKPKFNLVYKLSALTAAELSVRKSRGLQELGLPISVPIWPCWVALASMDGGNTVATISTATTADTAYFKKFKIGGYAYFTETGKLSTFRKISTISGATITFNSGGFQGHAGAAVAQGSLPVFTSAARVYPCIRGMKPDNASSFAFIRLTQSDDTIAIEEL